MINLKDFRILVIDDNPEIHRDFIKILTKTNVDLSNIEELSSKLFGDSPEKPKKTTILPHFHIDTASQGQEGVQRIAEAIQIKSPYSLAFVDIRMPPGWDGVETIKHIWELDKDIQIVICTAYSDYSWEETIEQLGENDNLLILKKPFDVIAVRQLAYALTQKWKLLQESRTYTKSLEKTVQDRTEELQYQALHDTLTELPNRALLYDRIQHAMTLSERNRDFSAIIFFDLDRFKLINDSLGHAAGDELLQQVAQRLLSLVRSHDTLARLGGDEFVLVAPGLKNIEDVIPIATTVLNAVKQPFQIQGRRIVVTASIGISVFPRDGDKLEDLLRNADTAMYRSKELGANQFNFYTDEMNKECLQNLTVEADLRQALENNEFCLYYQPQYDTSSHAIDAVEALIRWNHPVRGLLLPIDFISIAEKSGLITSIGEWVLREACRQAKIWQDEGLFIRIAINITSHQLRQFNYVKTVKEVLDKAQLSPRYLEFELSESIIINNENTIKTINALKKLGIQISIDDFGTGYSSLSYLKNISLDRLKIDRSFIKNIPLNKGDDVIIHAIITMARSLNLDVIAEGVETENQLEFLKNKDCGSIQGFYFSEPMPSEEFKILLKSSSANKGKIEKIK